MITIQDLPHINAVINLATVITLGFGWSFIRAGNRRAHQRTMKIAACLGAAFLVLYFIYHINSGLAKFGGHGIIRPIYFTILVIHLLGALTSAVLVPTALIFALKGNFHSHYRVARIAMPLWLFVGVSGLVVYVMALHLYPYTGAAN